jgi:hypothetical protein
MQAPGNPEPSPLRTTCLRKSAITATIATLQMRQVASRLNRSGSARTSSTRQLRAIGTLRLSAGHGIIRGMRTRSFAITPAGEFSLAESALFGFGQRMRPAGVGARVPQFDGVMRLAFCLDGYHDQVGVELRQDERVVYAVVHGPGELDAIQRQVARVLSLDHDSRGFAEVGQRDLVIGRLQRAAVGLRPPLFYSLTRLRCGRY